jgi:hypothetical protein
MKSTPKRLRLAKETVRMLSPRHLSKIAGGPLPPPSSLCTANYESDFCETVLRTASCDRAAMGC